ncbi:MAG: hypothetical protein Q8L02_05040 [Candidatus Nitrotoga sp.]|nr:hypothetical protein [Candidatus Nitrotoga sp.]
MLERYKLSLAAVVACLFLAAPAHAEEVLPWTPITQAEFKMLPPYCQVKLKGDSKSLEYKLWQRQLGPGYGDVHHYCGALMHLKRYYGATSQKIKRLFLQEANHNLDYLIRANVAGFSLLPDIYVDKGRTLLLQKKDGEAVQAFLQAIKLNPNIASAYSALSDIFLEKGDKQKALQYAEEGLKNVPNIRALQRRYKELTGHAFVPSAGSNKPAEARAMETNPGATGFVQPATPDSTPAEAAVAPLTTPPVSAADDSPKIGTPTNPYCRFCPP